MTQPHLSGSAPSQAPGVVGASEAPARLVDGSPSPLAAPVGMGVVMGEFVANRFALPSVADCRASRAGSTWVQPVGARRFFPVRTLALLGGLPRTEGGEGRTTSGVKVTSSTEGGFSPSKDMSS